MLLRRIRGRVGQCSPWGLAVLLVLLGVAALPGNAQSENTEWVFGLSTALTEVAANPGRNQRTGILAAFEEANRAGGVRNRRLRLECLDDGYDPRRTAPNMRYLVDKLDVLAVAGNLGTPTAVVALPIARSTGTPFIGATTGADLLRKSPPDRIVINFRASYREELSAMIDVLVNRAGILPNEVAFFVQRDSFGQGGYKAGIDALKRFGLEDESLVAQGHYTRGSMAVETALADILAHEPTPRAVIMVATGPSFAKFVRLARQIGLDAVFVALSYTGEPSRQDNLMAGCDGVFVTQVVPHYDADLPLVRQYKEALAALDPAATPGLDSLEGYAIGRLIIRGLQACPGEPTRETLIDGLESLGEFDMGLGAPLKLSPDEHQACHQVWLTAISNGRLVPYSWDDMVAEIKGRQHD